MRISLLRLFGFRLGVLLLLMVGVVGEGYGQRVYANSTTVSRDAGALTTGVENKNNAIDSMQTTYSTLRITLLGEAWQTVFFPNDTLPSSKSPVVIKFRPPQSLVGLGDALKVSRRNGAAEVGTSYSINNLLDLLWLLSDGSDYEFIMPGGDGSFNGLRLSLSNLLGTPSARYYYAFYIIRPEISSIEFCIGTSSPIVISNFQPRYTYKIYDQEIGGNEIPAMETSTDSVPLPSDLPVGTYTYWLEAREGNIYPSARTEFNVTIYPNPGIPQIEVK